MLNLTRSPEIIVAYNEHRVIGNENGQIPWHIPQDLVKFKNLTMDQVCIMGRKTWESLPEKFRPLPGRINVVVSRKPTFEIQVDSKGVVMLCSSLENALEQSNKLFPDKRLFIIGGGEIYREALEKEYAHSIVATEVKGYADVIGSAYFPELSDKWAKTVFLQRERYDEAVYVFKS